MNKYLATALALLIYAIPAHATVKDDIGFTQLQNELGEAIPNGSVSVFHIEARFNVDANNPVTTGDWIADSSNAEFSGKVISGLSTNPSIAPSSHATMVGVRFYGNDFSQAPGIIDIGAHSVDGWFFDQVIPTGAFNPSTLSFTRIPLATDRRVANHSWVSTGFIDPQTQSFSPELTASFLRHSDWLSDADELIQVFGPNNGSADRVLMATSYNGITAGRIDTNHADGVIALDEIYTANRPAIHLVSPENNSSNSAPTISSSAALLIDAGASNPSWSETSTTTRAGINIQNAERTEIIKAALMAGASRTTENTTTLGDIVDYRVDPANQTNNGLDRRYGAGQLNVYNSYQILAAGEQPSIEDGGVLNSSLTGFDHDGSFGGESGSNSVATYDLGVITDPVELTIALVWNLDVAGDAPPTPASFDETANLYDLDLRLIDVSDGNLVVAESASAIDNTENIWITLEAGKHYQIQVSAEGANFNWDYGIAWHSTIIPVAVPLHWPAIAALLYLFIVIQKKSAQTRSFRLL